MSEPKLQKAQNGIWYAVWSANRRSRRKSMGTKDVTVARTRFANWLLKDGPNASLPSGQSYRIRELWTVYRDRHVERTASPETAFFSWMALEPHFGDLLVEDVSAAVPAYVEHRLDAVQPATIRRELTALRACLNWCADGRKRKPLIERAPFFDMPDQSPPCDRWLTQDEIARLLAAAEDMPRAKLFLHLALETAGRKAAILGLTWDRVDFDTKVIHLQDPQMPATKKRRASVPISAALLPVLVEAYARRDNELVMGSQAEVYHAVVRIAKRAGIEGVTPHVLRHTAATHMARRGVSLWIVAKVLGNSLRTVEAVYAKHSPEDLRVAVDMISGK